MYWIYQTRIYTWRNRNVRAKLLSPTKRELKEMYSSQGFRSTLQDEPYGVDLDLTFQIHSKHKHPDHYYHGGGFKIFSERLVDLMYKFEVKCEVFKARLVDEKRVERPALSYYVFHSLEGILEAMDEEKSGWTGNYDDGISQLILDFDKFAHRPIFRCKHVNLPLMRNDLKLAITELGITGFEFLVPESYQSGRHGSPPDFD